MQTTYHSTQVFTAVNAVKDLYVQLVWGIHPEALIDADFYHCTFFSGWKCIWYFLSQSSRAVRSICKFEESWSYLMWRNRRQSLTKSLNSDVFTTSGKSFINARNRSGLKNVPWGTPESTSFLEDIRPSSMTCCDLPLKKNSLTMTRCQHGLNSKLAFAADIDKASYQPLLKIKTYDVHLISSWAEVTGYILDCCDELRFTWAPSSKAMCLSGSDVHQNASSLNCA